MTINGGIRIGGLSISPAFDADALAYFATAGITNADNKKTINNFVVGMKGLGYWSNMICWPLRSTQNAGSGTTAYSLGGLAISNGTLTNGPTWGADGIVFDGSNDYISLSDNTFSTGNSAESFLAFFQPTAGTGRVLIGAGDPPEQVVSYYHLKSGTTGNDQATMAFTDTTIAASDTSWKSLFQGNTTLGFKGKNGGTVTSFTLNNTLNKSGTNCAIGGFIPFAGANHFQGTISAVIKIDATPSTQLNSDVYSLYKTTLGDGLGLP